MESMEMTENCNITGNATIRRLAAIRAMEENVHLYKRQTIGT